MSYAGVPDMGGVEGFFEAEPVTEAVDGRPWKRACSECAFLDPPQVTPILEAATARSAAFYCVHREDGGEHRVCAGFAARDRSRRGGTGARTATPTAGRSG